MFSSNWLVLKANLTYLHQVTCFLLYAHRVILDLPGVSVVKSCLPLQETQEARVRSLSWEDPLEEGIATYSSILAWRISWTEEPGGLQPMGFQRVEHD